MGKAVKGKIFDVLWSMKKEGYSDYTTNFTRKALSLLDKHCDLDNPESIKNFLAQNESTDGYKRNLVYSYERYSKYHDLTWNRPKYRFKNKLPKIPTEAKVDMIISASNKKLELQLKISKETGLRPIEVVSLRVRDIDFDNRTIHTTTAKRGNPRVLKIKSDTLCARAYAL